MSYFKGHIFLGDISILCTKFGMEGIGDLDVSGLESGCGVGRQIWRN